MAEQDPEIYVCGVTESMQLNIAPWKKRKLGFYVQPGLPVEAYLEAFGSWQAVCGLEFYQVDDPSPGVCDIKIERGPIDGPLGTLAWSELPNGDDRRLVQRYDVAEQFVIAAMPPQGKIDLVAVACHEIGHAIGLDHTRRGTGDLMEPTYQAGKRVPQKGDVARVVGYYGTPVIPPKEGRVLTFIGHFDQYRELMSYYKVTQES